MLTPALQGDGAMEPLRGGVEWAARKPSVSFALELTVKDSANFDYEYRLECSIERARCELQSEHLRRVRYRLSSSGERSQQTFRPIMLFSTDPVAGDTPLIFARLYNEKSGTKRQFGRANPVLFQILSQSTRSEIQEGVAKVASALRDIFILDPIPSHMRGFSPLSERLDADGGNIAGVIAALPSNIKDEMEARLTKYVTKLPEQDIVRVYAEKVGKFGTDAMLYCEENFSSPGATSTVDSRGMSDGTLRFLAILTALLTRPRDSLLLIEEVDNGLHPSRSDLLLRMLAEVGKGQSVDVMVTTHNPALLDAMGTRMIPFITVAHRDQANGTSTLTLLEDVSSLPKLLAHGKVGKLTSEGLIEKALHAQFDLAA